MEKVVTMPSFNWETDKKTVQPKSAKIQRNTERAAALNLPFTVDHATVESVNWIYAELKFLIPLIKGMVRVMRTEKKLCGTNNVLTKYKFAEFQTCKKLTTLACVTIQLLAKKRNKLFKRLNEAHKPIAARNNMLKKKDFFLISI